MGILFNLRVKAGLASPSTRLFEVEPSRAGSAKERAADELARAKTAAREWCASQPGYRYIAVEPAIAFTEASVRRMRAADDDLEELPTAAAAPAQAAGKK